MKLLLKNGAVLLPDYTVQMVDIVIEDAIITAVGSTPDNFEGEIIDCRGQLAIPGLINTHTHAAMTLFRGYADDMVLMDWLKQKIWPAEARLTDEDVYWGTLLAIAEMIKSGTTTFADMYFCMDSVAKAVADSGMRAVLARGMAGVAPTAQQALIESEQFYRQYNGAAAGRITVMLGPHAPYTCPPSYLKQVVALAEKLGAQIHIHLAETKAEVEDCLKDHGLTPIALASELGVFNMGALAAHCVHVTPDDINILAANKVRVAHNPGSNMKLASGIAPVMSMLSAGVCVGLGTDGAASNNNLDLLEEVRLAALLSKVSNFDPIAIPLSTAFDMATTAGARCVGLDDITGKIAVGYRADIVLLDTNSPHWYPCHNQLSTLVYSAQSHDVNTVIINGEIVLKNRRLTTIDEERLFVEVEKRALRLTSR